MLSKIIGKTTTYKLEQDEYPQWFGNVFDYETHIAPHKVVMAIAPTGSGKTRAINDYVEKITLERSNKLVLIIENRRGRVDQTCSQCITNLDDEKKIQSFVNRLSFGGNLDNEGLRTMIIAGLTDMLPEEVKMFRRDSDRVGTIYNQHACITAAKFGFFLENIYDRLGEKSYVDRMYDILWDIFDLIIIDEVHSIVTDSTYQDAPFHSYDLISSFYKNCNDSSKHMILMTATAEPLKSTLNSIKDMHIYDFTDVCVSVKPRSVSFIDYKDVKKDIEANYLNDPGWNCVYFTTWPIITVADFCKDTAINPADVRSIFSNDEKREKVKSKYEQDYKRMTRTEDSIIKYGLPEDDDNTNPRIIICSPKYKEGMDFKWFINTVYISSHTTDDIIQMSGRARIGNHELKIVVGSNEYYNLNDFTTEDELFNSDKKAVDGLNEKYRELPPVEKKRLIKFVTIEDYDRLEEDEPYHPYIRFSFFNNQFQLYKTKHECMKYLKKCWLSWHKKNAKLKPNYYQGLMQSVFGDIPVEPFYSKEFLAKELLSKYMRFTNRFFDKKKKDSIETALCEIWGENHKMNWFLKRLSLDY